MTSGTFEEPEGATPLSPDDAAELIPSHITTRGELNAWEQANILAAARWVSSARTPALSTTAIEGLHLRMFNKTWKWAGRYRRSDTNIGVHWPTIPIEVENFVRDGRYWIDHRVFQLDEAAARLQPASWPSLTAFQRVWLLLPPKMGDASAPREPMSPSPSAANPSYLGLRSNREPSCSPRG